MSSQDDSECTESLHGIGDPGGVDRLAGLVKLAAADQGGDPRFEQGTGGRGRIQLLGLLDLHLGLAEEAKPRRQLAPQQPGELPEARRGQ